MTEKDVIRKAMEVRGYNQGMLAELSGFKRQSNVSEMLRGQSIRVDNFVRMCNAMGFDVIVKDRNGSNRENVWKIERAEE